MSRKRTYRVVPHEMDTTGSQLVDGWREACEMAQSIATEYRTPVSLCDSTNGKAGPLRRTFMPEGDAITIWGDHIVTIGVTVAVSRARLQSEYLGPISAHEAAHELLRGLLEASRGSVTNWRGRYAVVLGIERSSDAENQRNQQVAREAFEQTRTP